MSGRLVLRRWGVSDAQALRDAIDESLDHLKPWMSWSRNEPLSLPETELRLKEIIEQFDRGESLRYAIVRATAPEVILGGASLHRRVGPNAYEIGYWVRGSAARQGVASACAARLIVTAFGKPGITRLEIDCDRENLASAALARSLGFSETAPVMREHPDGSPRPLRRFELLRAAYMRQHFHELHDRASDVKLDDDD